MFYAVINLLLYVVVRMSAKLDVLVSLSLTHSSLLSFLSPTSQDWLETRSKIHVHVYAIHLSSQYTEESH